MRAADIVLQLRNRIPQLTGLFTTDVRVRTITRAGTVLTVQCYDDHGLQSGRAVALTGAITRIPLTALSRSGTVGSLTTYMDHDLTELIAPTISISNANEAEFNGTFNVIAILNRRNITFEMADAGPTQATGSPYLLDAENVFRNYNMTFEVKDAPSTSSFRLYEGNSNLYAPEGTIVARARPRIASAVNPDRMMDAYSQKDEDELWMFVILGPVVASKNRAVGSDAVDNLNHGVEFRQQLLQDFSVYVVIPCSNEIGAANARDTAEDLFRPICRSLVGIAFDSGLYVGEQGRVHFVQHGPYVYNTAFYVHEYAFQQVVDMTYDDTVGPNDDVAFRDLDFTMDPDLGGTTKLAGSIDLDDVPL